MKLPRIKENLLVQELKDEILIYDKTTNKSYCLNETAKTVFNACDGKKTFADLHLPKNIIYLSLDELKKQNLIQSDYISPFAGMGRRAVIKKVGLTSIVALPVIYSLIAPQPSHAASGNSNIAACQPCAQNSGCASGNCVPLDDRSGRKVCSNGSQTDFTSQPNRTVPTAFFNCDGFGTGYCCSGSAYASSQTSCTCN